MMIIDVKISNKQARNLAKIILDSGFFVGGVGFFDITLDDLTELLSILINSENKEDDLSKLYDELRRLYMSR
jgi:vacuolar-type H+-ATPase subunit D/Vma8